VSVQYLSLSQVIAIHIEMMERLGEAPQPLVRDDLLDSAINRVRWAEAYEQMTVPQLAARLATAIALAHAYTDGNKRTAFHSTLVFLRMNGRALRGKDVNLDFAKRLEALVATDPKDRDAEEQRLADWLTKHAATVE
jgi:death-on-curing protein